MRNIPKLTSANYVDKEFVLKNFSDYTEASQGISTQEGGLTVEKYGSTQTVFQAGNISAVKLFYVRQGFYAYCADKKVKKYNGSSWVEICTTNLLPCIIPFKLDGVGCTLVIGDTAVAVYDDGELETVNIPYAKRAVVYNNMLFLANDNVVWFSKLFEYDNFTGGLTNAGFVSTDKDYGRILALIPMKSYLTLVCERAIYRLKLDEKRENYSLVKEDVAVKAQEDSIQKVGDAVYLFSANRLCAYQNGKLSVIEAKLDKNLSFDGQSGVDENNYYASLIDGENNGYLLTYNRLTGNAVLVGASEILVCDGGYLLEEDGVKRLANDFIVGESFEWRSTELNFDSAKIKSLVGIEVQTDSPVDLELSYAYGKQELAFERGLSYKKVYAVDKGFRIKLTFNSPSLSLKKIKFIYRFQEE